jgi:exodeoxyribonuclease-5
MENKFQSRFPFPLTGEQVRALEFIDTFLEKREYKGRRFIRVGGLAGTGKTSVIANAFKDRCKIAAPTWVAAKRLSQELGIRVDTYHKVFLVPSRSNEKEYNERREDITERYKTMVRSMEKMDATKIRELRQEKEQELRKLEAEYPLGFESKEDGESGLAGVLIDESSMITGDHADHIMSMGVPVVFIGDHGQLPPVQGSAFFTGHGLDFELTQIVRQKDRELLKLLHTLRKQGTVPRAAKTDSYLITGGEVEEHIQRIQQGQAAIIAYKQADVRRFNAMFSGHDIPQEGDQIRVFKQYSDKYKGISRVFRNGYVYEVTKVHVDGTYTLKDIETGFTAPCVKINTELFQCERIDATLSPTTHLPFEETDGMRCDFVYSMTGHKAQGSQWPHVIVYAARPGMVGGASWGRWLYTAASRATQYLTLIVPEMGKFNGV